MLLYALLKGIAVGLVIALPAGPVGVLCVRRTIFEGVTYGLVSGLGAAAADTVFGAIAAFGLTFIRDLLLAVENWLGLAGGLFLLYFGLRALLSREDPDPEPVEGEALLGSFASTFALAVTNPMTILACAAIFAQLGVLEHETLAATALVVVGVLAGSLVWWLGLSFGIAALVRTAHRFHLVWLDRVSGAILTLSGAGLLALAGVRLWEKFA